MNSTITIETGSEARASLDLIELIKPELQYSTEFWMQGQFRKIKKRGRAHLIDKNGFFHIGLLPRILKKLEANGIRPRIIDDINFLGNLKPKNKPDLPGIKFREDQIRLINSCIDKQRGVIVSPTGSGKTVIASAITRSFGRRSLFLCHSISLMNQTADEFRKFGLENVFTHGGGTNCFLPDIPKDGILVSTIQSFIKYDYKEYCTLFDVVIIDEAHHASLYSSNYGKVLPNLLSKIKIGFTATVPEEPKRKLMLEGLVGPVIGEVTIEEGAEKSFLAKPKIKLVSVPYNFMVSDLRKYNEIYSSGIVNNRKRNKAIVREALDLADAGKTSLIMVKEIAHGDNIIKLADVFGLEIEFVQGSTENSMRDKLKNALENKHKKCVISTSVWREGINIPSLDCIINACGGKSEIMTLQAVGRGLRVTKNKKDILIIDFLDPYKYLAEHSVMRLQIYNDSGWL